MSNYKQELDQLQEEINNKKLEEAKLQERLKTLEEDQKKYQDELKELGVNNIEDLKKEIETLEEQIQAGIEKAKGQMK
jgi:septal ring factor EnvC (AmiA/AmiB activator)